MKITIKECHMDRRYMDPCGILGLYSFGYILKNVICSVTKVYKKLLMDDRKEGNADAGYGCGVSSACRDGF